MTPTESGANRPHRVSDRVGFEMRRMYMDHRDLTDTEEAEAVTER